MFQPGRMRGGAISLAEANKVFDLEPNKTAYDLNSMETYRDLYYPVLSNPLESGYRTVGSFIYTSGSASAIPTPGTAVGNETQWSGLANIRIHAINRQGVNSLSQLIALFSQDVSQLTFRIRGVASSEFRTFGLFVADTRITFFTSDRTLIVNPSLYASAAYFTISPTSSLAQSGGPVVGNEYILEWYSPTISNDPAALQFISLQTTLTTYMERISTLNGRISTNQGQQSTLDGEITVSSAMSGGMIVAQANLLTNKNISTLPHSTAVETLNNRLSTYSSYVRAYSSQVIQTNQIISTLSVSTVADQTQVNLLDPQLQSTISTFTARQREYSTNIYKQFGYSYTLDVVSSIRREVDVYYVDGSVPCIKGDTSKVANLPGNPRAIVTPQIQSSIAHRINARHSTVAILSAITRDDLFFVNRDRIQALLSTASTINFARGEYLCKLSTFEAISTARVAALNALEDTRVSTGRLASTLSTLDGTYDSLTEQYNDSLPDYNSKKSIYEVYIASTAAARAAANEVIALSSLSRLEENLAVLQTALATFDAGNPTEASQLYDSRLPQTSGTVPMVGGATRADIDLAIQTQQTLITSVDAEYRRRIQARIDAEREILTKRDMVITTTEQSYQNAIDTALDRFSTCVEQSTLFAQRLRDLSTQWRISSALRVQDSEINTLVQSTIDGSTLAGRAKQSTLDWYAAQRIRAEEALITKVIQAADAESNQAALEARIETIVNALSDRACEYAIVSSNYIAVNYALSTTAAALGVTYSSPAGLMGISTNTVGCVVPDPLSGIAPQTGGATISISSLSDAAIRDLYTKQGASLADFARIIEIYTGYYRDTRGNDIRRAAAAVQELSTIILQELSKRKMNATITNYMSSQEIVDPNIPLLRQIRDTEIAQFLESVAAEQVEFQRYIDTKLAYDRQSVFRKTPGTEPGSVSNEAFEAIKTRYDIMLDRCNYYIGRRATLFQALMTRYNSISSVITPETLAQLYTRRPLATTTLESRFPLVMDTRPIPPRPTHFIVGGLVPKDPSICDPTSLISTVAVDRAIQPAPTTTADTRACGIPSVRTVDITHPSNTFELRQIMVIDKTGRNVAFGIRPGLISLDSNVAFSGRTDAVMLTNGAGYATITSGNVFTATGSDRKIIRIILAAQAEVTAVRLIKPAGTAYSLLGTRITLWRDEQASSKLTETAATYSGDDVTVDLRPADAPRSCPITYIPHRRGVCGTLAQYVRIQRVDPPGTTMRFSQVIVLNSTGENKCLNKPVTCYFNGLIDTLSGTRLSYLTDGTYGLRTSVVSVGGQGTIVYEIDLGQEEDIAAVQLHNLVGGTTLSGNRVSLLNAERIEVDFGVTISNGPRDTIDFRFKGADTNCRLALTWPDSYGEAGIKAQYVRLTSTGGLSIKVCRLIDRNGKNIAFGSKVTSTGPMANPMSMVSHGTSDVETMVTPGIRYIRVQNTPTRTFDFNLTQIAVYAGSSVNQALGKTPVATNGDPWGDRKNTLVNGTMTPGNHPNIYSSVGTAQDYVEIDLGSEMPIDRVVIVGRVGLSDIKSDGCQLILKSGSGQQIFTTILAGAINDIYTIPVPAQINYDSTDIVRATIDLGYVTEICGVYIEGSAVPTSIDFSVNQDQPTITFPPPGRTLGSSPITLDTRYDPAVSKYPFVEDIKTRTSKTGIFGVFTQTILVESRNGDVTRAKIKVTDATGKEIVALSPTATEDTETINGMTMYLLRFVRQWEVNSVILDTSLGSGRTVILRDCNRVTVEIGSASISNSAGWIADFRKIIPPKEQGPLVPYPYQTGPHGQGVRCRYIKVIPRNSGTALALSQIIAINACGRNVALEKDTYATNTEAGSSSGRAVDGVYVQDWTDPSQALTLYQNYFSRPAANSFVSAAGDPASTYWVVDLGPFINTAQNSITTSQTICDNQITVNACQDPGSANFSYDHEINCVILVAPRDMRREAVDVIVQLIDNAGQVVGIQKVNRIVGIFGVDFLDFRLDTSRSLAEALAEPPRRSIQTGLVESTPRGIVIQYVRLEARDPTKAIQLSQVFVLGTDGRNVALYKPTRSSLTTDTSYRAVDGNYFTRPKSAAFVSGNGGFLEVNLMCPVAVTKVFTINAVSDPADVQGDKERFENIRIKLYNASRDPIELQTGVGSELIVGGSSSVRLPTVGISIAKTVLDQKYEEDMIPTTVSAGPAPTPQATVPAPVDTSLNLQPFLERGTSEHKGVRAMYLRILNPTNYIQISQLMVFDNTLTNIARTLPASNVFASHALPGRQPERAVDGQGGYFHQGRAESQCYISEKKPYEFWQLRLIRPVRFVRYSNQNANQANGPYIQIRELEVFDLNGNNVARGKPATASSKWGTSGTTISATEVTDGNRDTMYHSAGFGPDEYVEIDLQSDIIIKEIVYYNRQDSFSIRATGAQILLLDAQRNPVLTTTLNADFEQRLNCFPEIIGLKYIPPASNRSRNAGLRFQLLDAAQNVCAQYVVDPTESTDPQKPSAYKFSELWVDFRLRRMNMVPIQQVCMPKLTTQFSQDSFQSGAPFSVAQDSAGNLFATDYRRHIVLRWLYTNGTFSGPTPIFGTSGTSGSGTTGLTNPTGIVIDTVNNRLYVADNGNNRICALTNYTSGTATLSFSTTISSPYGLSMFNGRLYATEYLPSGRILEYGSITSTSFGTGVSLGIYTYPTSVAVRKEFNTDYIYAAIGGEGKVKCIQPADTSRDIGKGNPATQNTTLGMDRTMISLNFPTGVTVDPNTNTLFIVDSIGNTIYYVPPDQLSSSRGKVLRLAGSGVGGSEDTPNGPAINGSFDTPFSCLVHNQTGDLFITDFANAALRRVLLGTVPTRILFTDRITPPNQSILPTTTVTGDDLDTLPTGTDINAMVISTDTETIREVSMPALIRTV